MPKTIAVVDEMGNVYQPTYARRAKGLVKNGRARWLDENRICLACPPKKLEENAMMEQNAYSGMTMENAENEPHGQDVQEQLAQGKNSALKMGVVDYLRAQQSNGKKETACEEKDNINLHDLLERLHQIQQDSETNIRALDVLQSMDDGDSGDPGSPGNLMGEAKARAISDVAKCHETTNQKLIDLYEKMYDDIMRQRGMRD